MPQRSILPSVSSKFNFVFRFAFIAPARVMICTLVNATSALDTALRPVAGSTEADIRVIVGGGRNSAFKTLF